MRKQGLSISNVDNKFIFAATLRKIVKPWNKKDVKREIAKKSFKSILESNIAILSNESLEIICKTFHVQFVLKNGDNYVTHGNSGDIICIDENISNIFFDRKQFYFFPKGLLKNGKVFDRLDDILNFYNIPYKCALSGISHQNFSLEPCPFRLNRFTNIEETFNLGISIWTKTKNNCFTNVKNFSSQYKTVIQLHFQKETNSFTLIQDEALYFTTYKTCSNRKHFCMYTFSCEKDRKNHLKNCRTRDEVISNPCIEQTEFGPIDSLFAKAIDNGLLGAEPENKNFLFFDIECILPEFQMETQKTVTFNVHNLLSIAVNSYINGEHNQRVWVVKDESKDEQLLIVQSFLEFCFTEYARMKIDPDIQKAFNYLQRLKKELRPFGNFTKSELARLSYELETFLSLNIFGYNSSKYDNNVVFDFMIEILSLKDDFKPQQVQLIKKGNKYFSIKFGGLHFKDLLNFTCPMPLDKYLRTWTSNFHKLVYPYEYFKKVEDIYLCTAFHHQRHSRVHSRVMLT